MFKQIILLLILALPSFAMHEINKKVKLSISYYFLGETSNINNFEELVLKEAKDLPIELKLNHYEDGKPFQYLCIIVDPCLIYEDINNFIKTFEFGHNQVKLFIDKDSNNLGKLWDDIIFSGKFFGSDIYYQDKEDIKGLLITLRRKNSH